MIVATGFVIAAGSITHRQPSPELLDVPDLAQGAGREAGRIGEGPGGGTRFSRFRRGAAVR